MPVHSLLTRNDLQLICSQEQQPKGNFPPSLNRFLIDYQLQSGKATGLTCRKDAKYMEGQWSLLSHYLLPKFSSPRYWPSSQGAEVCANKEECSVLCIARGRLEAGSHFLKDSESRGLLSPLKLVSVIVSLKGRSSQRGLYLVPAVGGVNSFHLVKAKGKARVKQVGV